MSLLVMNASQLCLCKYERLKTIRCVVKQTNKQKHGKQGRLDPLVSRGHTLLI